MRASVVIERLRLSMQPQSQQKVKFWRPALGEDVVQVRTVSKDSPSSPHGPQAEMQGLVDSVVVEPVLPHLNNRSLRIMKYVKHLPSSDEISLTGQSIQPT